MSIIPGNDLTAMTLEDLVKPENVLCNAQARSKKHCLEILSELLSRCDSEIAHEEIFEGLVERERLGCTGLDSGIAFPHCRVEGVKRSCGAFMRLSSPVDFDTSDSEHVDLVFGLMVPLELDDSHVADIKLVTSALNDKDLRERLREAHSSSELYKALLSATPTDSEPQEAPT
ncbi:MAG: PTS transporter subunit EIIA [Woeseia sp.]|nr:PTS sugar transporter subunit IIA [Woeseia sp.]MBT8095569.1 PTS sugar transporter subunit IIA [Woeseia sp.]NNE61261.1 PTS transporter subunit EIIA [Woeseia sp.]NNL53565.1 PTS transporter subunit EIIA [Woeseia sp.]